MQGELSPLILVNMGLMLALALASAWMLSRGKVTPRLRLLFVIGGTAILGFALGLMGTGPMDPNPVSAVRGFLQALLGGPSAGVPLIMVAIVLGVLIVLGCISNRSVCGWSCHLGLFQDALSRARLPKWKPPFWLANSIRIVALAALVGGLLAAGADWIGWVEPLAVFRLDLTPRAALFAAALFGASLFVYRPWCQFLCPFGLIAWLGEQVSLMRVRIDRSRCADCRACVRACPTESMEGIYAERKWRAECYSCGACLGACPVDGALTWGRSVSEDRGVPTRPNS